MSAPNDNSSQQEHEEDYSRVELFKQDCEAEGVEVVVTDFPETDEE